MATQQQLNARLNPTPVNIKVPTTGLFRPKGELGILNKRVGDTVTHIDLVDLLIPDNAERLKIGNYGAQVGVAQQRLKEQYGIDIASLPEVNMGDLSQSRASTIPAGQKLAPRMSSVMGNIRMQDINQFLGVSPSQLQTMQQNTQKNQLAEGAVDTSTPNLSQFGEFTRQLQFGSTGEDVKRLQQFLNASGFQVAKEGEAGSRGNETEFFGPNTQKALQAYQKSQGIVDKGDPQSTGFGRLGPQTLKSVNTFTTAPPADTGATGATGGTGGATGADTTGTGGTGSTPLPDTPNPQYDDALEDLLNNPNLTDDQKAIAQELYDVVSKNDEEKAKRMIAGFEAGIQFSEPFFKAQTALVTNALIGSLSAFEGDLEFSQKQLENTLNDLREDIQATTGYMDIEKEQALKELEKSHTQDLENTRQNLAAVGKTSSSVRGKSEQLLTERKEGLVESTSRKFGFESERLKKKGERGERDTQAQIKQLQAEATQKRIAELRRAEEVIGSQRLSDLGFTPPVGDVGGSLERQRLQSGLSFASGSGFVF